MKLHYVYYAIKKDGNPKVGVTKNAKFRPRLGKYKEFIILESYECPKLAGDKEIELQLKYFGKRDSKLHYIDYLKIEKIRVEKSKETRKKNKTKIKITNKDRKKIQGSIKKNLKFNQFVFKRSNNGYIPAKPKIEYNSVGINHRDNKLKVSDVLKIRKLYDNKQGNLRSLAKLFNVSTTMIYKIVNKKSWKHV